MATGSARNRRASWLFGLLIVSLAVNVFVLGAIVTKAIRPHHREMGPQAARWELRLLKDRLPADALKTVETSLATLEPDIRARIDRLKALRIQLGKLYAAPTPDRAAIDAGLRDIRLESGAMQEQVQSRTTDAVLALPAGERALLASPGKDDDGK